MALSSQDTQAYQQAVSAYINGSYEEAAAITELLIETRSDDPNLQLLLGHIYCCLQRIDIAREHYQIVLESTSDPELVECVNNSLSGINQSGSLQETRSTESPRSGLDQVSSSTNATAELDSSPDVLEAELDKKNSNSTNLNLASPVTIEPNQAKSDPVFVDPFSSHPASSSNINVPASYEAAQTPVDDHLKNYPVDVYDDLGELPDFSSTENLSSQSDHESALTGNTETGPSQLDSKQTNLFAAQDESAELLTIQEHQSGARTQTTSTLTESQLTGPQSRARGVFAGLENTSLKTKQLLAAIATGIISATAVIAVSQVPKTNMQQASTAPQLASGLAAVAAGIAGGVASFTLGQMTTKRIKRTTDDLQAKFDAVIQGDFKPQAMTYSDDEGGRLATSFDQMIDDGMNQKAD